MSTSLLRTASRRARVAFLVAVVASAGALVGAAWLLGEQMAPTEHDAAMAHEAAYEQAYHVARADAYGPAYDAAWREWQAVGADEGSREGAAAGTASVRTAGS